jgi:hypothetical protein
MTRRSVGHRLRTSRRTLAELLTRVLRAVVLRDSTKAWWAMDLIHHIRRFVLDATISAQSEPGARRHRMSLVEHFRCESIS